MRRRVRLLLCPALAVAVGAGLTAATPNPANATTVTGNSWTYQMNNPAADGLIIRGTSGTNNPLIVFDRFNQPIAAVGEAGGFKVFGDNIGVNAGFDIYHSQVTISPTDPAADVCVRAGQLWLGGSDGHIWRCVSVGLWQPIL